ncbi:MFS transporter, partial [Mesorhizobium sp. M5C.F.Ca.IN.020.14.1.1]
IVPHASGFSEGLPGEPAANVAPWLFLAFVPLGILGCLAALRISGPAARPQEATS